MKKLLQKIGCFFLILILIKLAFVAFYGDDFVYENLGAAVNKAELEHRKSEFAAQTFDTVFIGSSRTVFGVAPTYFDSLNHKNTRSYNFGIFSGTPPRTFDWCEELIKTKPSLKYIFFELSLGFEKTPERDNRLLAFFRPSVPRKTVAGKFYGYNMPLEEFLNEKDDLLSREMSLENFQPARSYNPQIELENSAAAPLNKDYWDRISRLIELAESKQIKIYFFIPPRINSEKEFQMIHPLYQKLDDKSKLKVRHFDESLYRADMSFDAGHLNYKGAKKFTELLAEAFDDQ